MFLFGAFQVGVDPTGIIARTELSYEEASRTHLTESFILIDGTVQPYSSAELLLNGKRSLERLPIRLQVVGGQPTRWGNPEERKTRQSARDAVPIDLVAESVGQFSFVSAYERQPDSLWVDVKVPQVVFADLWSWARSDSHLAAVYFHVYGEAMDHVDYSPNTVYHWTNNESDGRSSLHVANFGYAFHRSFEMHGQPGD